MEGDCASSSFLSDQNEPSTSAQQLTSTTEPEAPKAKQKKKSPAKKQGLGIEGSPAPAVKHCAISFEKRQEIVDLHKKKMSYAKISHVTGISVFTVRRIVHGYKTQGMVLKPVVLGRPRKSKKDSAQRDVSTPDVKMEHDQIDSTVQLSHAKVCLPHPSVTENASAGEEMETLNLEEPSTSAEQFASEDKKHFPEKQESEKILEALKMVKECWIPLVRIDVSGLVDGVWKDGSTRDQNDPSSGTQDKHVILTSNDKEGTILPIKIEFDAIKKEEHIADNNKNGNNSSHVIGDELSQPSSSKLQTDVESFRSGDEKDADLLQEASKPTLKEVKQETEKPNLKTKHSSKGESLKDKAKDKTQPPGPKRTKHLSTSKHANKSSKPEQDSKKKKKSNKNLIVSDFTQPIFSFKIPKKAPTSASDNSRNKSNLDNSHSYSFTKDQSRKKSEKSAYDRGFKMKTKDINKSPVVGGSDFNLPWGNSNHPAVHHMNSPPRTAQPPQRPSSNYNNNNYVTPSDEDRGYERNTKATDSTVRLKPNINPFSNKPPPQVEVPQVPKPQSSFGKPVSIVSPTIAYNAFTNQMNSLINTYKNQTVTNTSNKDSSSLASSGDFKHSSVSTNYSTLQAVNPQISQRQASIYNDIIYNSSVTTKLLNPSNPSQTATRVSSLYLTPVGSHKTTVFPSQNAMATGSQNTTVFPSQNIMATGSQNATVFPSQNAMATGFQNPSFHAQNSTTTSQKVNVLPPQILTNPSQKVKALPAQKSAVISSDNDTVTLSQDALEVLALSVKAILSQNAAATISSQNSIAFPSQSSTTLPTESATAYPSQSASAFSSQSASSFSSQSPATFSSQSAPVIHNASQNATSYSSQTATTSHTNLNFLSKLANLLPATAQTQQKAAFDSQQVIKQIVSWNHRWLEEQRNINYSPNVAKPYKLEKIKHTYSTPEQYFLVYYPMLLYELWTRIYNAYAIVEPKFYASVDSQYQNSSDMLVINCHLSSKDVSQLPKSTFRTLLEGLVLEVGYYLADEEEIFTHTLGYVFYQRKDINPEPGFSIIELGIYIKNSNIRVNSHRNLALRTICNAGNFVRQAELLSAIGQSDIGACILNPENGDIPVRFDPRSKAEVCSTNNVAQARCVLHSQSIVFSAPEQSQVLLVEGPPGTGKTHLIGCIIQQLVLAKPKGQVRILLVAPSDTAVDVLGLRLKCLRDQCKKESKVPPSFVRVGHFERVHSTVEPYVIDHLVSRHVETLCKKKFQAEIELTQVAEKVKGLDNRLSELKLQMDPRTAKSGAQKKLAELSKKLSDLVKKRTSLDEMVRKLDMEIGDKGSIRKNYLKNATVILSTINSCRHANLEEFKFTCCIVDESTQCTEPALLSLILEFNIRKLILLGDPEQLPASVKSTEAFEHGYGMSMFERMFYIRKLKQKDSVIMLTEQYRMHDEICDYPANEFYDGRLVTTQQPVPFSLKPYTLFDLADCPENMDTNTKMVSNLAEATFVANLASHVQNTMEHKSTIGIIAPYREHVKEIVNKLGNDAKHFDVGIVDEFQGRERDIIILSCAQASSSGFLGFMKDCQRLNVALTRASHCLVICGNLHTLRIKNDLLKRLVADAECRNLLFSVNTTTPTQELIQEYLMQ